MQISQKKLTYALYYTSFVFHNTQFYGPQGVQDAMSLCIKAIVTQRVTMALMCD